MAPWRTPATPLRVVGDLQVFRRIDYQIATRGIAEKARAASIYKETRFSDHAPLVIDYDMAL